MDLVTLQNNVFYSRMG